MSKLEKAASKFADEHGFRVPYNVSGREITNDDYYDKVDIKASMDGFIAGAEWQKDNMWISVEESLPNYDDDYFICLNIKMNPPAIGLCDYDKIKNKWFDDRGTETKITHWMPIPKHDVNH